MSFDDFQDNMQNIYDTAESIQDYQEATGYQGGGGGDEWVAPFFIFCLVLGVILGFVL